MFRVRAVYHLANHWVEDGGDDFGYKDKDADDGDIGAEDTGIEFGLVGIEKADDGLKAKEAQGIGGNFLAVHVFLFGDIGCGFGNRFSFFFFSHFYTPLCVSPRAGGLFIMC